MCFRENVYFLFPTSASYSQKDQDYQSFLGTSKWTLVISHAKWRMKVVVTEEELPHQLKIKTELKLVGWDKWQGKWWFIWRLWIWYINANLNIIQQQMRQSQIFWCLKCQNWTKFNFKMCNGTIKATKGCH